MKRLIMCFAVGWLLVEAPVFAQDIVSDLELHVTFSGNANDSSGNARHLTASAPSGDPITYSGGAVGNAAIGLTHVKFFQLANDDGGDFLDGLTEYTVACWVRTDERREGHGPVVTVGPFGGGGKVKIEPFAKASGLGIPRSRDGAEVSIAETFGHGAIRISLADHPAADDAWHLIALVVDEDGGTLYVIPQGGATHTATTTAYMALPASGCGIELGGAIQWEADFDELRVYSRALTEQAVEALAAE